MTRPPRRLRRLLPFLWMVGLLCAPGVAYLAGVRQDIFENRAPDGRPPLSIRALADPGTFTGLDAFVRDRLPFREDALDLRGRFELAVYGQTASPAVFVGRDDWLFFRSEERICDGETPATDVARAVAYLVGAARATGRRATFLPSASKVVVERERLDPDDVGPQLACVIAFEDDLLRRLRGVTGVADITPALRRLVARGTATFRRWDTHWATPGFLLFARAALDAVEAGLAERLGVRARQERRTYAADLARFTRIDEKRDERIVAAAPGARGRPADDVLLVGDSQAALTFFDPQGDPPRTLADTALPGLMFCGWSTVIDGRCVARLRRARTLLVETVLRHADFVEPGCQAVLRAWLSRARGRALRWRDGAPDGSVTSAAPGETLLVVDPDDDTDRARVLVVPVTGGPAGSVATLGVPLRQDGRPEPCSTHTVDASAGTMVLPVGEGRRLEDVTHRVVAPAGTRFGPPRVVTLPRTGIEGR